MTDRRPPFHAEPYAGELAAALADAGGAPEMARLLELRLAVRGDPQGMAEVDRLLAILAGRDGGDAVVRVRVGRSLDALAERTAAQARARRSSR